jgi:amino acid adenylation domain-containing protein
MEYIYTLDKILPRAAKLHARKTAFKYLNDAISYEDLEEKTNQLAHYLLDNGIGKGDRIGILLPRSLEIPIALYAILKVGAAFVPLDFNMPTSRLQQIVQDCQMSFIVTCKNGRNKIKALLEENISNIHTIGLENPSLSSVHSNVAWNEIYDSQQKEAVNTGINADDLAYIMYTSGTTGTPKGIMHTHYSGLSYAKLSLQQYGVQSDDIIANHSPLHFDISTFGYLTAPLACATTVIISEGHTKFPVSLAQLIQQEEITIWYSVPVALIQLSNLEITSTLNISSIRWVLFGGESYPAKELKKLMDLWPKAQFSNVYGPAEVNQCTHYTVPKDIDIEASIPLGYIWPNTEMLILDEQDQPVPKGEIGKLLISSATMMYGYWNKEELTEKAFYISKKEKMKNFSKKYYRTGDLVKIDTQGLLIFYGRGDRQIKTRGYRVELNEVELALLNIPEIKNAAVFSYNHQDFGKLIAASIVLKTELPIDTNKIQNILAKTLPKYSIPEKFNFVDSIKRTPAGKIDYAGLSLENNEH